MSKIILKSAPQGDETTIGWQLSGFRKVAHYIYGDGDSLKTKCGIAWMMSDACTSNLVENPKCKRCAKLN